MNEREESASLIINIWNVQAIEELEGSWLVFLYVNVVLQAEDLVDEITNPGARSTLPHARVRIFIDDSNWNPILEEC